MRNSIIVYINGLRHEIKGEQAFMSVASYLRYVKGLTGTKIVCSEGDCGACTVILSRAQHGKMGRYHSINSCISFIYLLDKCHLITVEGLADSKHLHEVQDKMVELHGSQCGYCTPGIVCSMASMSEDAKNGEITIDEKKVKNYLTGNLCRCTGYEPIINAGKSIDINNVQSFESRFEHEEMESEFSTLAGKSTYITHEEKSVSLPASMDDFFKNENYSKLKITSGATDLGVVHNKGKLELAKIITLNNIEEAYKIFEDDDMVYIGAKTSLNDVEKFCHKSLPSFSKFLHIFASLQIKNKGTLVGNFMNASPIGDTIPFLRVADALVLLESPKGQRLVNVNDFIKPGYKQLDIKEGEIVTQIQVPKSDMNYKLYKVSIRRDLDISSVGMAVAYKLEGQKITDFKLAIGGVGPSVLRISNVEKEIVGKTFNQTTYKKLAKMIDSEITPLSDVRGSESYRRNLSHNLLLKFCDEVMKENGFSMNEASL